MESSVAAVAVDRPIFIVGPHRSGTTLLYKVLAQHPEVGYLNRANRRLRSFPTLAHFCTRLGMQDMPMEAQKVWDRYWALEDDTMDAEDATDGAIVWYRHTVRRVLELRGATRFLAKYPRLSLRLGWVDRVFPGAIFVHLARDWRAVVNSTVVRKVRRAQREGGWFGVRIPGWREMDGVPHELAAGRTFRHVTRYLEEHGPRFGDRFRSFRYEALCGQPEATLRAIAEHCQLRWCPELEAALPRDLRSANYKWREQLDASMVDRIRAEDAEFFARHEI